MPSTLRRELLRELEEFWSQDVPTSLRRLGVAIEHIAPSIERRFTICHFVQPDDFDPGETQRMRRVD